MNKLIKPGIKKGIIAVIVFSVLCAFGLFFFLLLIENIVIGERYRNHDYVMDITRKEVESFQEYVSKNDIATTDIDKVDNWVNSRKNVLLIIYDNGSIVYDSAGGTESSVIDRDKELAPYGYHPRYTITFANKKADVDYIYFSDMRARFIYSQLQFLLCFLVMLTIILVSFVRFSLYYSVLEKDAGIIMNGDVNHRITVRKTSGLGVLAGLMEEMRASIVERHEKENSLIESGHHLIMTMSHDLRTPLTILIGYLEILTGKKYKNENAREMYTEKSLEKAYQIKQLSDKIFEYFLTFNMNDDALHKEIYNKNVFSELMEDYLFTLNEKHFKIEYSQDKGKDYFISMDIQYMRRVFDNIFSNITKYADKDKAVVINVFNNSRQLIFSFSNGIRQDRAQVESTNIGLTVCDKIISKHGGSLEKDISENEFKIIVKLPISRSKENLTEQ